MSIILIAAVANNGVVGKLGKIPWKLSSDLQHFKRKTLGQTVIMGRKTFDSLGQRPLKDRNNIVVSNSLTIPNLTAPSLIQALWQAQTQNADIFIIGGERLWAEGLNYADRMIITHVKTWVEQGDAFFPYINSRIWTEQHQASYEKNPAAGDDHDFNISYYRRT